MNKSFRTYEWVESHIWISFVSHIIRCITMDLWKREMCTSLRTSHVTHMNKSSLRTSHVTRMNKWSLRTSHVTHMNQSSLRTSHVRHMNKSETCTFLRTSHVTHMNKSFRTYGCVKSHIWINHVTHIDVTSNIYMRDPVLHIDATSLVTRAYERVIYITYRCNICSYARVTSDVIYIAYRCYILHIDVTSICNDVIYITWCYLYYICDVIYITRVMLSILLKRVIYVIYIT